MRKLQIKNKLIRKKQNSMDHQYNHLIRINLERMVMIKLRIKNKIIQKK